MTTILEVPQVAVDEMKANTGETDAKVKRYLHWHINDPVRARSQKMTARPVRTQEPKSTDKK